MSEPDRSRRSGSRGVHRAGGQYHGSRLLIAAVLGLAGFILLLVGGGVASGTAVAQQPGTQTISVNSGSLADYECNAHEWHFVITQIDTPADAPATIHVSWANGQQADVPLLKVTGGVGHYTTTLNLDSTVTSATAVIYGGWSGTFNLSHGPCGTTTTTTAPPSSTSASTTTAPPSSTSASTTTAPPSSTSASTTTAPPSSTSASTTTAPPSSTSASTTTAVVPLTSPFVPGPGQTGDVPTGGGGPVKAITLGSGLALLGSAVALSGRVLRRRGSDS
jgi:hypothetical protein